MKVYPELHLTWMSILNNEEILSHLFQKGKSMRVFENRQMHKCLQHKPKYYNRCSVSSA